jgi:hypothetical protein
MPEATVAELLVRARSRLERQDLYPRPLRDDVRLVVWPWFFRIPWYRRYVAYTLIRRIALSAQPEELTARHGEQWLESLLVHELCHVWQVQHHPIATGLAHLRYSYRENPFEIEARAAAQRGVPATPADAVPRRRP